MLNTKLFRQTHNIVKQRIKASNIYYRGLSSNQSLQLSRGSYPAIDSIKIGDLNNDEICINWSDGYSSLYPSIFLRDNCNDSKTQNGQRLFETYQLKPDEIKINSISFSNMYDNETPSPNISVKWNDESVNTFSAEWLYENSLNEHHRTQRKTVLSSEVVLWDNQTLPTPNLLCSYSETAENKIPIYKELKKYGVCLIDQAPTKEQYDSKGDPPVINVANILGFVRETNYGKYFDVRSVPTKDSINLAYTARGLSVHTDNPYRNPSPGVQLLHCIKQATYVNEKEGNSVLIDGFKVAEEMRVKYPDEFKLLSTIKRPFTYYDLNGGYKFHKERYVIGIDERGEIENIYFNNRCASCVNWNIDERMIKPYYAAWQLFAGLANDPEKEYAIEYRLEPGQILVFNNNRVLHGRKGYTDEACNDDGTGLSRHLQGCYIDSDTVWARLDAHDHLEREKMKREKKMYQK